MRLLKLMILPLIIASLITGAASLNAKKWENCFADHYLLFGHFIDFRCHRLGFGFGRAPGQRRNQNHFGEWKH